MRVSLSFLLLFYSLPLFAPNDWGISDLLRITVEQDVRFNDRKAFVAGRSPTLVPIYSADVEVPEAVKISKFITPEMKDFFLVEKNGKKNWRVFSEKPIPVGLSSVTGPTYTGVKVTSHSTHLVWDRTKPSSKPLYIKLTDPADINPKDAAKSVEISDFVEENLKADSTLGEFLPERLALTVEVNGKYYSNIAREAYPEGFVPTEEELLLPVHSLLDADNPVTKAWNRLQKGNWAKHHFAKKFGTWIGNLHYGGGIHPEAHGQNTLVRVNPRSGEIKGFVFRDMHDTAFDPMLRALQGKRSVPGELLGMSIVNLHHVDLTRYGSSSSAAGILDAYTINMLLHVGATQEFLEGYVNAASRWNPTILTDQAITNWMSRDPTLAIDEVYKKVISGLAKAKSKDWSEVAKTPAAKQLLQSRLNARNFGTAHPHYRGFLELEGIRYMSDGKNLFVLTEDLQPIVVLPDLVYWEKERAGIPKHSVFPAKHCGLFKVSP